LPDAEPLRSRQRGSVALGTSLSVRRVGAASGDREFAVPARVWLRAPQRLFAGWTLRTYRFGAGQMPVASSAKATIEAAKAGDFVHRLFMLTARGTFSFLS